MKKKYIIPLLQQYNHVLNEEINTSSGVHSSGSGYGGVDEDGNKDPASKRREDEIEDEEFEMISILIEQEGDKSSSLW